MNVNRRHDRTKRGGTSSTQRRRRLVRGGRSDRKRATTPSARPHLSIAHHDAAKPPPAYEWLSAEDRMFLSFEGPNAHMHVGAALLFGAGPFATVGHGVSVRRIRQHIEARLEAIPRYRQRLHPAPIDGQPVWIDDDRFDLSAHVRHVRLAAPGSAAALRELCGRIGSMPLDRARPLWELWIVDGLRGGQFALVSKLHHCMVDGVAGADLLAMLLSPTPDQTISRPSRWVPRPPPPAMMLLGDRTARQSRMVATALGAVAGVLRHPTRASEWSRHVTGLRQALGLGLRPAARSPLNRPIGPHRRLAWSEVDFSAVKDVKNRLGGTVNDVVLATVAGALRRFLLGRDPDEAPSDLRALIPVNTRTAAEAHALGNHVAAWLAPLPVSEPDPLRRFARVRDVTGALRGSHEVLDARALTEAGSTLLAMSVRLLEWLRPFNLVITNIPGPPMPLYLLGARLEHVYPLVPLFPNQGLGIAVFSYADKLCWGFNADCHVVPDLDTFARAVRAAFDELAGDVEPAAEKPARRAHRGDSARAVRDAY